MFHAWRGNVLESDIFERIQLANGKFSGLFERDEFTTLMTQCKGDQREGLMLVSVE